MLLIKCIVLCIILIIAPIAFGNMICHKDSSGIVHSAIARYILGMFSTWALFWALCVSMTFLKLPFSALAAVYSILLVLLGGISIQVCRWRKLLQSRNLKLKQLQLSRFEKVYLILFLLLLGVQLYFAVFYESTVWSHDDYEYVVRSLDTITSDHMFMTDVISGYESDFSYKRVLNSWEIFIAYLSKVSGFHVTTIAHTVIPAVFLVDAYLVYFFMAMQLFNNFENRMIFLCLLSTALMFGLYSPYSLTTRLLTTLWHGKAILSAIVVPFLISFLPQVYRRPGYKRIYFYLSIISASACSLTMMGSGMAIAVYVAMFAVISVYCRRLAGAAYCLCGCAIPSVQMLLYLIMR